MSEQCSEKWRRQVSLQISDSSIEEILQKDGRYVCTTIGYSMYPMLRDRRDTVVIRSVSKGERLKKYDVPLYKRGDRYILHRIIKVLPHGYDIIGDNCVSAEKNISDEAVIGVLEEYWRGNRKKSLDSLSYKLYVRMMRAASPFRIAYKKLKAGLKRLVKRLIGRK